jgi:hypothetical protein
MIASLDISRTVKLHGYGDEKPNLRFDIFAMFRTPAVDIFAGLIAARPWLSIPAAYPKNGLGVAQATNWVGKKLTLSLVEATAGSTPKRRLITFDHLDNRTTAARRARKIARSLQKLSAMEMASKHAQFRHASG